MSRIKHSCSALLICLASMGCTRVALASGDGGCSASWRLLHHAYEGCSNMAFLSPANDTRVNLLLLMADLRPARGSHAQAAGATRPDAPLFLWEELAYRLGTAADKTLLRTGNAEPQSGTAPLPTLNDPFIHAVEVDGALSPEERGALLAARQTGQAGDAADRSTEAANKVAQSTAARAYVAYLQGAAAFWRADYGRASAIFSPLMSTQSLWVRETATYMAGRTLIDRAQVGAFDEYGSFAKNWHADATTVTAAEIALDKYLQQYPKGAYAQSARGLKRRGYWLAHDTGKLEEEYGALMLLPPEERSASDVQLAQEIDSKLLTAPNNIPQENLWDEALLNGAHNPLLLATLDLQAMRTSEPAVPGQSAEAANSTPLSLSTLQKQKPYFAAQMPLYEFLLAVHALYVDHKPAEAAGMLPDAARQNSFSTLQFSRQIVRGMALEAMKDRNASGFWTQMIAGAEAPYQRPVLELAVAFHSERAGELRNVFASGSPVQYPFLREVLLANVADAALLRSQATNSGAPRHERDLALFTLLYKEATRSHPAEFLKDVTLVPEGAPVQGFFALDTIESSYFVPDQNQRSADIPLGIFVHDQVDARFGCPGLRHSEEQLAKDPGNPTAKLCVADFVRLNPAVSYLEAPVIPADELGGTRSLFPGGNFARMSTYTAVLADARSSKNDKAYALFRAINCYGPSGNNGCGGNDVPQAQRKAWFTALKRDYAGTQWANTQRYYW